MELLGILGLVVAILNLMVAVWNLVLQYKIYRQQRNNQPPG